jgi:hypothetical protein
MSISVHHPVKLSDTCTKSIDENSSANEKRDCIVDGVDRQQESTIIRGVESEYLEYGCIRD